MQVRLTELEPFKRFMNWLQDDLYPRLNTEAPALKTDLEEALARLFAECVQEDIDGA